GPDGKLREASFRMVRGGTFVWPIYETAVVLSLKPATVDLVLPGIAAHDGHTLEVTAVAQVRIKPDDSSLVKAAESLPGKTSEEIGQVALGILESSFRSMVGGWSTADTFQRRGQLGVFWQETALARLSDLGLEVLSLSVRDLKA